MDRDTRGGGRAFPPTRHSILAAISGGQDEVRQAAFGTLVAAYWKPVYKYLRLHWRAEPADAQDLTQAFFTQALEKDLFARYEPGRSRFRTYLRVCLDGFAGNQRKEAGRLKRGGGATMVPLDFEAAEGELGRLATGAAPPDPEACFHREWVRSLFDLALADLVQLSRQTGRGVAYALFERYDLDGPEAGERLRYADLARQFGLTVTQVTNHLAAVRREFRRLVLERLRELTATEEEFRAEARHLLGVDP